VVDEGELADGLVVGAAPDRRRQVPLEGQRAVAGARKTHSDRIGLNDTCGEEALVVVVDVHTEQSADRVVGSARVCGDRGALG